LQPTETGQGSIAPTNATSPTDSKKEENMAKQVKKLSQQTMQDTHKKRVAAYVRVSMQSEDLLRSYVRQIEYYTKLIKSNPEWEFVQVFADKGITGTSAEKRDAFMQMLDECEKGNIQIILTKSISRFSRNTIDLLQTVRHLKDLGIEVRFEKENISSLSGDGELMLTILASFAQEESRNISENVKWGIRKRNEKGMNASGMRRILGYKPINGEFTVVEEEAVIVRRIFEMFNSGTEIVQICRILNAENLKMPNGREFLDVNVTYLLKNEMYIGDRLTNKFYIADPLTHRSKRNCGEVEQFYIEGDHMPIIDKEVFEKAQERFAERMKADIIAKPYHGIIFCGYCGATMFIKRYPQRNYYICTTHKKTKTCDCKTQRGDILDEIVMSALEMQEFDPFAVSERIQKIQIFNDKIIIQMKDGRTGEWQKQ